MMKEFHIKSGDVFNRLTCIKLSYIGKHNRSYFLFKCDCGNEKIILGSGVKSGNTKSCGCLSNEMKSMRISENHCEITAIILGYKRHAKERMLIFELTRKFINDIVLKDCYYCGSAPSNFMKTKNSITGLKYNGIDRYDSNKGYTEENCKPCCKICNNAKSNLTPIEFISWINKLSENKKWGNYLLKNLQS